ncbi:MAG: hypothetical protein ACYSSI_03030 [Planctomycetota bacterium]|jgi:hypothetical protein
MKIFHMALTLFLLVIVVSCSNKPARKTNESDFIIGNWVIIESMYKDSRSDVEPEMHTIRFDKDGTFRSWCRISDKDEKSTGRYAVINSTEDNAVVIAIRMKSTGIHPNSFELTDVKRGDISGYDDQGNVKLYKDILTFTDHNERKRGYKHE